MEKLLEMSIEDLENMLAENYEESLKSYADDEEREEVPC